MTNCPKEKFEFIVETDGLLNDYIRSVVFKRIKAETKDDKFILINANQIRVAMILRALAPCSLKAFAEAMIMSKAAASALVDRMVQNGIVRREANENNRREILLWVASDFEAHVSHVVTELSKWFEGLSAEMGIETFEKWYDAMLSINHIIHKRIRNNHE